MKHRVWHRTAYTYNDDVNDSLGLAFMTPRQLPWQNVEASELVIEPDPGDRRTDTDHFGNTVHFFQISADHRELTVTASSDVEVSETSHANDALAIPWESARPATSTDVPDSWSVTEYTLASPLVPHHEAAGEFAAVSLTPGRPLGEALDDLTARIHSEFAYDKTATTVTSTLDEVVEARAGVCQDFAHLMLAGLRAHGLAARYVSGYLATTPPPGKEKVFGADASHAWVAVWVPGGEWLALDPTNNQRAGERYITVAWGRDYKDVPPVRGIIFTEATESTLSVEVDVSQPDD